MTVKPVTPLVPAIGGGLQFYRDLDGVDLEQDSRWDEVDPSGFYPDPRLTDLHQGSYVRRTRRATRRVEPSLLNEHAGHRVGLNSRPACSPTTSPDGRAAREAALSGAPEILLNTHSGASNPSDEQRRAGGTRRVS